MTPQLEATLAGLPTRPGVYLMRDARGTVLYVGKAQNLRARVRSYWQRQAPGTGPGEVHRIREVIDRVADLEYTLTDSVSKALLLEATLIKRSQSLRMLTLDQTNRLRLNPWWTDADWSPALRDSGISASWEPDPIGVSPTQSVKCYDVAHESGWGP